MKMETPTFRDWRKGSVGRETSGAQDVFERKDRTPITKAYKMGGGEGHSKPKAKRSNHI